MKPWRLVISVSHSRGCWLALHVCVCICVCVCVCVCVFVRMCVLYCASGVNPSLTLVRLMCYCIHSSRPPCVLPGAMVRSSGGPRLLDSLGSGGAEVQSWEHPDLSSTLCSGGDLMAPSCCFVSCVSECHHVGWSALNCLSVAGVRGRGGDYTMM